MGSAALRPGRGLGPALAAAYGRARDASAALLDDATARLAPGLEERELAAWLDAEARRRGARGRFHSPVVLFGERTAPPDGAGRRQLLPSTRSLVRDEPVLMDIAPLWGGIPGDVSRTVAFGEVPELTPLLAALGALRNALLAEVRAGRTQRELARFVDRFAEARGMASCRGAYLCGAVGHPLPRLAAPGGGLSLAGVSLSAATSLAWRALGAWLGRPGRWPFWSDHRFAETAPGPGAWSVEPHFSLGKVGAKWEEVLLIGPQESRWIVEQAVSGA